MKITSLDLYFLLKELKELVGARVQHIKQIGEKFIFEIYKKEKLFLKIVLPRAIFISRLSEKAPEKPTSFCMQLRKYLLNKRILDIYQHEFDRIVEIVLNGYKIIIELFSKGNLILTDSKNIIINLLYKQEWKDRILKPKKIYKYPPSKLNPFKYTFFDFQKLLSKSEKEIVKILAKDFGFGGKYAEAICFELDINKNKHGNTLNQQEIDKLFRFFEQLKEKPCKPFIVYKDNKLDFVPFKLKMYQNFKKKFFDSFNNTLSFFFEEEVKEVKIEKMEEKIKKIKEIQEERLKELIKKEEKYRKAAALLYERYVIVEDILNGIFQLHEKYKDWKEVEKIAKERTEIIKEILPEKARLLIFLNGEEIEIDFRKSVEENASFYFELAKKMKKKIEGLKKAMKKIEIKVKTEKPKIKVRKKWYERYRWFFSSNGILVVAGKNARNNETIVKRYARKYDLIMHADLHGSPFAVIRNDKKLKVLPAETIYEAAELVASYSSAWKNKIPIVSVYYVKPEQLIKEPNLPLGSFIIRGERKWLEKIKPRISIGAKEVEGRIKLIYGPPTAVKKQTPYLVTIIPGNKKAEELAEEIKKELLLKVPYELKKITEEIEIEEIKKIIPYGVGELVR